VILDRPCYTCNPNNVSCAKNLQVGIINPRISGPESICQGTTITLTASGGTDYNWSTGQQGTSIEVTPQNTTTISVTISQNGCSVVLSKQITVKPSPGAQITSNQPNSICFGLGARLSGTGNGSFLWSNGSTGPFINVAPSNVGNYNYGLTVTGSNGCVSSANFPITVKPLPTVSISPASTNYCPGQSPVTLTASGGTSFLWSTGATSSSIAVSPLQNTTYTVNVTQNGCTTSSTATVNVADINVAASKDNTCPGEQVTLTASGGGTYSWTGGLTGSSISVSPTQTTTYTVTSVLNGCTRTATITVNVVSSSALSISPSVADICAGDSITLAANGGSGQYTWSTGATTSSIKVSPSGTTPYSVTLNQSGCISEANRIVSVRSRPNASVSPASSSVCPGQSVNLVASGGNIYSWTTGANTAAITVNPTSNTNYQVTVSNNLGCSVVLTAQVAMGGPPATITPTTAEVCAGDSILLTASGGTAYSWSNGRTTASIKVAPSATTTYSVTVSSGSCAGVIQRTVNVQAKPNPSILPLNATICAGQPITLAGNGGGTYNWSNNATTSSITVTPGASTTYTLTVTNNGCSSVVTKQVVVNNNNFSLSASNTLICVGQSVTLSASGGTTYNWTTSGTGSSITVSPTATTTYVVTISNGTCSATLDRTITVVQPPSASISPSNANICSGQNITLTASGGDVFSWSNGATTSSISVAPTATTVYSVTVSRNGCAGSSIASRTVNVNTTPTAGINASASTICNGQSTTLSATGTGTYSWSNGATTSSIVVSPNAFNTYFVTVNNAGCTAVASRDIVVNSTVASITADRTTLCTGQNAQLSAGGGTYLWSTGATNATISVVPTATTTYSVTATNNNCSSTATITITVNAGLSPTISGPTVICTGGSATISTTGGTSYLWSTGATTSAITVNNAGTYQVTVSNNSCSGTAIRAMTVATNPTIDIGDAPLCAGTARNIIASEGSSYNWSTGATTRQITVSTNGTYTVSVTKDGCTNSVSRALTFNTVPTVAITGEQNICAASTSVFTASGGTGYVWSNAATTSSIVIGTAGTYTVTVSNAGGCTAIASRVLNVGTSSSQTAIASVGITNDADCTAGNARVQVNLVNSISANYRLVGVRNWQTSNVFPNLSSGTYNLEVSTATNGSACVDRRTVVVDEKLVTITGVTATGNEDCNPNNFQVSLQFNATAASNPQFRLVQSTNSTATWGIQSTFTGGMNNYEGYFVQARSSTGCIVSSSWVYRDEPQIFPQVTSLTMLSGGSDCVIGNTTIRLNLSPTPLVALNPDYNLNLVGYRINGVGNFVSSNQFSNRNRDSILAEVNYKYQRWQESAPNEWVMIDERTCNFSKKLFVPETTPPVVNITPATVTICPDQSTNLTASGGNTYAWSNGETTATINVAPTATTIYTVTVSDGTCPVTKTVTVTVLPRPSVSVSKSPSLLGYCAGQSVTLTPSAGFASYLWTTGSTDRVITVAPLATTLYKVTVTGSNGCTSVIWTNIEVYTQGRISPSNPVICNGQSITLSVTNVPQNTTFQWSTGQTTSVVSVNPSSSTIYSVTITQPGSSCGSVSTRQVIVNPNPSANVTGNAACAGQNTTLTATGGTNYLWSTGATTNTVSVPASPNMYSVTVSDANSCSTVVSRSVTNSPPILVSATLLNPLCFGQTGSINLSTTGLSPFTYQWVGGATTASRSGLSPGSYTVTVTDGNNCTQLSTYTITGPSPLAFQTPIKDMNCFIGNTGEIEVINVSGGLPPYYYSWINNWTNETMGNGAKISNLALGTYTVVVSDANACTLSSGGIPINRPWDIVINQTIVQPTCNGGSNAQISLSISGGTSPYIYAWSGGGTASSKIGLAVGSHSVTVTDAKGCTKTKTFTIGSPTPIIISETISQVSCNGGANGQVTLNVTGGTAPYTYNWLSGANTAINTGLSAGSHGVTVTDANNCSVSKSIAVGQSSPIAISETITDVSCNGGSNGQVNLSVSGGLAPYTYSWAGGGTSSSKSSLLAGSHTVTVTDANNCSVNKSIVVNQPNALSLSVSTTNATCAAQSNGQATALVSGGTSPYTYNWTNGGANATNTTLSSGAHFLTLTDAKGCLLVQSFNISAPLPIVINETITNVVCAGQNTGQIDLNVSGGVTPYSFAWTGGGNGAVKSGLTAGTYVVTVTDAQGCNSTKNITVSSPAPLAYNVSVDNNNDCLSNNVTLTIAATGGSGNYSYRLNNGVFQSSALFSGISNGFYTITLKDGAGCSHSSPIPFQVAEALPLSLSVQLIAEEDCIANNTQVLPTLANAQGGTTFLMAPLGSQNFSDSLMNKGSGTYIFKAEDGRNCVLFDTIIISETLSPVLTPIPNDTLSCDSSIIVLRAVDYANSTYQWKSTGNISVLSPNRELSVSKPGVYVLKVTTTQSCSAYDTVIVATILPTNILIDTFPATHCDSANARIHVNVGGFGTWMYKLDSTVWTSNPSFNRLSAGLYKISIAPSYDTTCMLDTLIRIGSREKCIEICQGDSVLIGKPGLNAWCMKWDPETGVLSPNSSSTWVKPTSNVTYRLYLTDDEGNILDSLVYNITICPELITNHDTLNLCDQTNAKLLVSGGVGPYLWKDQAGQVVGTGTEFSPTLPGRYTVTQANGLVLPKSVWVIKDILNRDLDIESPLPSLCTDSLVLNAAGNFQQYSWKNQQGALLSSSTSMVVREPGTYTLVGGITPGCQLEKSIKVEKTPFFIKLEQKSDTLDIADYQTPSDFYHNLSGIGEQLLGLNSPEGKTFIVSINKGCFDCGVVTIEVKDSLLNPSDKCHRLVQRKWIARNDCGRKSVFIQNLVLRDEQLPKFLDFPKDSLTVKCGSKLPDEVPLATDNSGRRVKVTLFKTEKIGRRSCDTLVIRHWRAIDSCGNDSIRKQFILIKGIKEKLLGVANPHQCGVPYQEPVKSQVLRQSLQADDVIWMYGFPVKIWDVTGGNGIFSGNGLLTLPFKQEAVKVTFADIRVNEDGKVIAGSMQAVRSANGGNFKCRTLEKVEYCPTYTSRKDSIANELKQAANGFKNCLWQGKTPPGVVDFDRKYDPYGFDCNGNHRNGGTTNEFGCTQAQMNDPKDSKCYGKIAPWSWLTAKDTLGPATEAGTKFADAIKDSLGIFVLSGLDELIIELEDEESEQISICANLRRETSNAFKALGLADSSYVFGSKGQYIKAGMWRQFLNEPKVISLNASRVAGMEVLETKHVELFACDRRFGTRFPGSRKIQGLDQKTCTSLE
jgi:SprB repeat